jgi:UDP-glucose 4-epimerase
MVLIKDKTDQQVNIFNVGTDEWTTVRRIGELVVDVAGLSPVFNYTGGDRGWKGDVPKMLLSIKKLKSLSWTPEFRIERAIEETAKSIWSRTHGNKC